MAIIAIGDRFRPCLLLLGAIFFALTFALGNAAEIFLEWNVSINTLYCGIMINGMSPGPLINVTTNDVVHVNVFNRIDEPLLMTWNGIQQRLNSWQDGVSGTNCPIQPGSNWTYVFTTKDQIGTFFYFPSINFHKAGGGYGPIRVHNRDVIAIPYPKPDAEFDLLIGDWYEDNFEDVRFKLTLSDDYLLPNIMLINGKGTYLDPSIQAHEYINVTRGETYLLRISNVGTEWSFNFRIQNHSMVLVETEGSYTNQITLDSLDVYVGQSYSVLVTTDQDDADYYMVASPKRYKSMPIDELVGVGVLHYTKSTSTAHGPLPNGPDPFDTHFSVKQAQSIRWNMTAGAGRPNPQGTFNVTNVTISQTFILRGSMVESIYNVASFAINNVSYFAPSTPLKLADQFLNGSGVYQLDQYPSDHSEPVSTSGTFVVTGNHKGWLEIVFKNDLETIDAWHLDGFGFYVVGFGDGEWTTQERSTYNLYDPIVRSTVQVYPGGWTAVYVYLDNPGMWNLRSQVLKQWYLGQELYVRVYDPDHSTVKERPPPQNILYCGLVEGSLTQKPLQLPVLAPPPSSGAPTMNIKWYCIMLIFVVLVL